MIPENFEMFVGLPSNVISLMSSHRLAKGKHLSVGVESPFARDNVVREEGLTATLSSPLEGFLLKLGHETNTISQIDSCWFF